MYAAYTPLSQAYGVVTKAHALFTCIALVPALCTYINAVEFKGKASGGLFEHAIASTFLAWFWGAAGAAAITYVAVADTAVVSLPRPLRMFTYGWFTCVTAVGMVKAIYNPADDALTIAGLCVCATVYMARAPLHTSRADDPEHRTDLAMWVLVAFAFISLGPAIASYVNHASAAVVVPPVALYCMWGAGAGVCALGMALGQASGVHVPTYTQCYVYGWLALAAAVGVIKAAVDPTSDALMLCIAAACAAMHLVRGGEGDTSADVSEAAVPLIKRTRV